MLKIILSAPAPIPPFCEPARDLRIQNTPLWFWQRNALAPYADRELVVPPGSPMPTPPEPALVYRDNLYFDGPYLEAFVKEARLRGRPVRAAFRADDPGFREHALPSLHLLHSPERPVSGRSVVFSRRPCARS